MFKKFSNHHLLFYLQRERDQEVVVDSSEFQLKLTRKWTE
jgi:hypothetical protein